MLGGFDASRGGAMHDLLSAAASTDDGPRAREPLVLLSPTRGGPGGVLCALDGAVSTLPDIVAAAGLLPGGEPADVLAGAFKRLGVSLLERLRGSFSLALWDPESRLGLLVRDPVGASPVFTARWGGGLLFASEVADLLAILPRRPDPDRLALLDWLGQLPGQSERTLFAGVAPLRPGHALILEDSGVRSHCYWQPVYRPPDETTMEEAVERFRAAARSTIAADPRAGPRGVLLSGGIDSCTVAALASEGAPPAGRPRAYSMVFPDHPEVNEGPLIAQTAAQIGLHSTRAAVRDGSPLAFGLRFLDRWALPSAGMNGYVKLPLMAAAADDGVAVMLDGEGGDELFSLSPWLIADHLRRGHVRAAYTATRRIPGARSQPRRVLVRYALATGLTAALPLAALRRLRRPTRHWLAAPLPWIHAPLRAQLRAREDPFLWRRFAGPRWWAYQAYSMTALRENMGHRDSLRREYQMAGLPGQHPLLDQELVELVLSLPPELAYDPDVDRPLARESVCGLIPDAVRLRVRKSFFDPPLLSLVMRHDVGVSEAVLRDPKAELRAFLDTEAAAADLFDRGREHYSRGPGFWLSDLWRLTLAEVWLRAQSDAGVAARLAETLADPVIEWQRG